MLRRRQHQSTSRRVQDRVADTPTDPLGHSDGIAQHLERIEKVMAGYEEKIETALRRLAALQAQLDHFASRLRF